jgi:predicted transcriptional regulator YdeE
MSITLHLTSYNLGPNATEDDYDHWIGYVCQKINEVAGGGVVDEVEASRWGEAGEDRVTGATDEQKVDIKEALETLWQSFCAEGAEAEAIKVAGAFEPGGEP